MARLVSSASACLLLAVVVAVLQDADGLIASRTNEKKQDELVVDNTVIDDADYMDIGGEVPRGVPLTEQVSLEAGRRERTKEDARPASLADVAASAPSSRLARAGVAQGGPREVRRILGTDRNVSDLREAFNAFNHDLSDEEVRAFIDNYDTEAGINADKGVVVMLDDDGIDGMAFGRAMEAVLSNGAKKRAVQDSDKIALQKLKELKELKKWTVSDEQAQDFMDNVKSILQGLMQEMTFMQMALIGPEQMIDSALILAQNDLSEAMTQANRLKDQSLHKGLMHMKALDCSDVEGSEVSDDFDGYDYAWFSSMPLEESSSQHRS